MSMRVQHSKGTHAFCILKFAQSNKLGFGWIWYKIAVMNQLHNDKLYDVVGEWKRPCQRGSRHAVAFTAGLIHTFKSQSQPSQIELHGFVERERLHYWVLGNIESQKCTTLSKNSWEHWASRHGGGQNCWSNEVYQIIKSDQVFFESVCSPKLQELCMPFICYFSPGLRMPRKCHADKKSRLPGTICSCSWPCTLGAAAIFAKYVPSWIFTFRPGPCPLGLVSLAAVFQPIWTWNVGLRFPSSRLPPACAINWAGGIPTLSCKIGAFRLPPATSGLHIARIICTAS